MKYPLSLAAALFAILCVGLTASAQTDKPSTSITLTAQSNPQTVAPTDRPALTLAQPQPGSSAPLAPRMRYGMWAGNPTRFFEGAFAAFLGHESGHLIANAALDTDPYLKGVHYGPVPFFTIEPGKELTRHEHAITASAGFNAQNIINEWILTSHPNLSREDEPFLKGLASFNFWLSVGYAATAFAGTGPDERDTKGMADALGWNERWVGAMILVPTALDTYRYKHPDSKWAIVASRLSKLAMIGVSFSAHN